MKCGMHKYKGAAPAMPEQKPTGLRNLKNELKIGDSG